MPSLHSSFRGISVLGRHLEFRSMHNHCAEYHHFQDTLTRSNLGQEGSCFNSEIHGGEGTAAGALAVVEEAYCEACYITQIRKQRQIGNGVRLTPPEMDFFQHGSTSPSFHISQKGTTIWEPCVKTHEYVGDILHLSLGTWHLGSAIRASTTHLSFPLRPLLCQHWTSNPSCLVTVTS